jgi:hypothetical protein
VPPNTENKAYGISINSRGGREIIGNNNSALFPKRKPGCGSAGTVLKFLNTLNYLKAITRIGKRSVWVFALGKLVSRRREAQTCFTTTTASDGIVEGQSHKPNSSIRPLNQIGTSRFERESLLRSSVVSQRTGEHLCSISLGPRPLSGEWNLLTKICLALCALLLCRKKCVSHASSVVVVVFSTSSRRVNSRASPPT